MEITTQSWSFLCGIIAVAVLQKKRISSPCEIFSIKTCVLFAQCQTAACRCYELQPTAKFSRLNQIVGDVRFEFCYDLKVCIQWHDLRTSCSLVHSPQDLPNSWWQWYRDPLRYRNARWPDQKHSGLNYGRWSPSLNQNMFWYSHTLSLIQI